MSDINPYAPPSVLDPPVKPDPGVGVWRDGDLFVTHRDASLPPVCVKTGQPAVEWVDLKLSTFDLYVRGSAKFTPRVPISARAAWLRVHGMRSALIVAAAAIVVLPFTVIWGPPARPEMGTFSGICLLAALIAIMQAIVWRQFVSLWCVRRDYFWFAGAHRRFLAQLPPWPGMDIE